MGRGEQRLPPVLSGTTWARGGADARVCPYAKAGWPQVPPAALRQRCKGERRSPWGECHCPGKCRSPRSAHPIKCCMASAPFLARLGRSALPSLPDRSRCRYPISRPGRCCWGVPPQSGRGKGAHAMAGETPALPTSVSLHSAILSKRARGSGLKFPTKHRIPKRGKGRQDRASKVHIISLDIFTIMIYAGSVSPERGGPDAQAPLAASLRCL